MAGKKQVNYAYSWTSIAMAMTFPPVLWCKYKCMLTKNNNLFNTKYLVFVLYSIKNKLNIDLVDLYGYDVCGSPKNVW